MNCFQLVPSLSFLPAADPEFLSRQGKVRLSLLKNLARAIKEVSSIPQTFCM